MGVSQTLDKVKASLPLLIENLVPHCEQAVLAGRARVEAAPPTGWSADDGSRVETGAMRDALSYTRRGTNQYMLHAKIGWVSLYHPYFTSQDIGWSFSWGQFASSAERSQGAHVPFTQGAGILDTVQEELEYSIAAYVDSGAWLSEAGL